MDKIVLWDGKLYDRDIVERASPNLLKYALTHPVLEEMLYPTPSASRTWLSALVIVGSLPAFAMLGFILIGGRPFVGRLPAPILYVYVPLLVWLCKFLPAPKFDGMSVRVEAGQVHIDRGRKSVSYELANCRWFRGFSFNDVRHGGIANEPRTCITNRQLDISLENGCIACGHTPEMREIWEAFFRLTGIPQDRDRSPRERTLMVAATTMTYVLLRCFADLLTGHARMPNLGGLFAVPFAVSGTLMMGMYVSALCGNDRWSSQRQWFWYLVLIHPIILIRFAANAGIRDFLMTAGITVLIVALLAAEITRPRKCRDAGPERDALG